MSTVDAEAIAAARGRISDMRIAAQEEGAIQAARDRLLSLEGSPEGDEASLSLAQLCIFGSQKEQAEAVERLTRLQHKGVRPSDVTWWLAVAYYECGRLRQSRELITSLAIMEPSNRYAEGFLGILLERYRAEGASGLLFGGLTLAAIGVVALGVWWMWPRGRVLVKIDPPTPPVVVPASIARASGAANRPSFQSVATRIR